MFVRALLPYPHLHVLLFKSLYSCLPPPPSQEIDTDFAGGVCGGPCSPAATTYARPATNTYAPLLHPSTQSCHPMPAQTPLEVLILLIYNPSVMDLFRSVKLWLSSAETLEIHQKEKLPQKQSGWWRLRWQREVIETEKGNW